MERMTINNPEVNSLLPDDEIDLREVLAAFRRRWIWVASGGLLGLGIAAGVSMSTPAEEPLKGIRIIGNITQSPRAWTPGRLDGFNPGRFEIFKQGGFLILNAHASLWPLVTI